MTRFVTMPLQMPQIPSPVLLSIRKKVGQSVDVGEILFSYEADGAVFEEAAAFAGRVNAVLFREGERVEPETPIIAMECPA